MKAEIIAVVIAIGALFVIWVMNIWGGWAEKLYEQKKSSRAVWFWLRTFGIENSPANCVRFIKMASSIGAALMAGGLALFVFKV